MRYLCASVLAVGMCLLGTACERPVTAAAPGAKDAKAKADAAPPTTARSATTAPVDVGRVTKTDAEWKRMLSPLAYNVLRQKATERAFSDKNLHSKAKGIYACAGCGLDLFASDAKFDSGTGWPSFWQPIAAGHVKEIADKSHGMVRTEVVCARCDGHLGHVFDDGPKPTGLRYCMNAVSMKFVPEGAAKEQAKK